MSEEEHFYPDQQAILRIHHAGRREGFHADNTFDQERLRQEITMLLLQTDLPEKHYELLLALTEALGGTHPKMKVSVQILAEYKTPQKILHWRAKQRAQDIADQIDMAVAAGVKQEAAVVQAEKDFSVSRRDIFRCLKEVRLERIGSDCDELIEIFGPRYPGFRITNDGRLVPDEN